MQSDFKVINVKELMEKEPEETPGKFYAYIQESGYVAIKHYTTKFRYEELMNDGNPLFVPVFQASGYKDAKRKIETVLMKAHHFLTHSELLKE